MKLKLINLKLNLILNCYPDVKTFWTLCQENNLINKVAKPPLTNNFDKIFFAKFFISLKASKNTEYLKEIFDGQSSESLNILVSALKNEINMSNVDELINELDKLNDKAISDFRRTAKVEFLELLNDEGVFGALVLINNEFKLSLFLSENMDYFLCENDEIVPASLLLVNQQINKIKKKVSSLKEKNSSRVSVFNDYEKEFTKHTDFLDKYILEIGDGFNPDTDFADYIDSEGKELFSVSEATKLNQSMEEAYDFFKENDLDIYAYVLDILKQKDAPLSNQHQEYDENILDSIIPAKNTIEDFASNLADECLKHSVVLDQDVFIDNIYDKYNKTDTNTAFYTLESTNLDGVISADTFQHLQEFALELAKKYNTVEEVTFNTSDYNVYVEFVETEED